MTSPEERGSTWEAYARHVAPGKVAAFERYGFDVTMGERSGVRFHDAFSERSWINCHCNAARSRRAPRAHRHASKNPAGLPFELRRKGLMMALKFPREDAGIVAAQRLFAEGVFAVYAANDTSAVQFLPPLVISDEELGEVLAAIRRLWG